jgi:3-demethoxyubiquinol 3-hydroxylase
MGFQAIISADKTVDMSPERANPGNFVDSDRLSESDRKESATLMRINHAGEVSAQALYQGQAVTASSPMVKETLLRSAREEIDHLKWCQKRVSELGSHTSYLGPVWYGGSYTIGIMAGMMGDDWNLGFVAETEKQVVNHLESHLSRLPKNDDKSRAILEQMRDDENKHASVAMEQGAKELPDPVKRIMKLLSRMMTETASRI